jgi:hypothetical protein
MKPSGQHPPDPARLSEVVDHPDEPLCRLGALVRAALPLPPRPAAARHLVRWRIRTTLAGRRRGRRMLRPAIIVGLIFATGAVLGATLERVIVHRLRPGPVPIAAPVRRAASSHRGAIVVASAPVPGPVVAAPPGHPPPRRPRRKVALAPAPASPRLADPEPASPSAPGAAVAVAPPPDPTLVPVEDPLPAVAPPVLALGPPPTPPPAARVAPPPARATPRDEQTLLAAALEKLRADRNPAAALPFLDELESRFPSGILAPEAASLRAEALVQLGRAREALRALDSPALASLPPSAADQVLRGELQASLRQWPAALRAFDAVVASGMFAVGGDALLVERALWGRAVVRRRLGDDAGARTDLEDYLRRFPAGRFASAAARALGGRGVGIEGGKR